MHLPYNVLAWGESAQKVHARTVVCLFCVRGFKSIGVHGRIGDCAGRREVPESLEGCSTRGEATPIRKTQVGSAVLESAEGNCGSLRQIFVQAEPRFPPSVLEHVLLLQRKEEEHRSAYLV